MRPHIYLLMVFLVLAGLVVFVGCLKKIVAFLEIQESWLTTEVPSVPQPVAEPLVQSGELKAHIAAITAVLHEFTSLIPGTFKIDKIEALDATISPQAEPGAPELTKAQIAAIAIALHEFTSIPVESFRITGVKPLGRVSAWKTTGRLELMGMDGVDAR